MYYDLCEKSADLATRGVCPLGAPDAGQGVSLRRLLEEGPARLLDLDDDEVLTSVNTAADDLRVRTRLGTRAVRLM